MSDERASSELQAATGLYSPLLSRLAFYVAMGLLQWCLP